MSCDTSIARKRGTVSEAGSKVGERYSSSESEAMFAETMGWPVWIVFAWFRLVSEGVCTFKWAL